MTISYTYIKYPVVNMRKLPDFPLDREGIPSQKVISQALYGEEIRVLEEQGTWAKIQLTDDQYVGWVKKESFITLEHRYLQERELFVRTNRLKAHIYHVTDTEFGPILSLPFGRKLRLIQELPEHNNRWLQVSLLNGQNAYIQRGDVDIEPHLIVPSEITDFAHRFLDLPYTWGGRSSFGFDCSGFMQMLFKEMGYAIPRDAKDQYQYADFTPVSMDELEAGDLIFFGPKKENEQSHQRITHVVMYIGIGAFIHAGVRPPGPYLAIARLADDEWREGPTNTLSFREARRHICFRRER